MQSMLYLAVMLYQYYLGIIWLKILDLPMQQQAQYLHQFVLHSALDSIDDVMWTTKECHLKVPAMFGLAVGSVFV